MKDLYKNLKESGRWYQMTLQEQLGNVGSDIDRVVSWKKKGNEEYAAGAFYRALDLLDLTISDKRWYGARLKELCRIREVLCDSYLGSRLYNTPLEYFSNYFYQFALLARKGR